MSSVVYLKECGFVKMIVRYILSALAYTEGSLKELKMEPKRKIKIVEDEDEKEQDKATVYVKDRSIFIGTLQECEYMHDHEERRPRLPVPGGRHKTEDEEE
jgi:hypothetical protein